MGEMYKNKITSCFYVKTVYNIHRYTIYYTYDEGKSNMKKMLRASAVAIAALMLLSLLTACGVPANTVFSVDDLPGKKIGTQLGTTGWIYALDYEEEGSTIEAYKKGADAVLALKQGKIDCVIIDNEPAKKFVEKNGDALKILADPFALEEYAIAVAKENTELLSKINAAIAQLKSDGTLDKIIKNYIGDDTIGSFQYTSPANVDRSNGTLRMATNAEFEPYEYYKDGVIVGVDADMAQAIADILGMELKIESMDFNAILASVQSGKSDIGVAGLTVRPDRLESVNFTDSYTTATQVIIVRSK